MHADDQLASLGVPVTADAPIPTWFDVGGRADRLAAPRTLDQLRACLAADPNLRVLGDGANLLVADDGIRELVVSLGQGEFSGVTWRTDGVRVGAGAKLPQVINDAVRRGLSGLETLAGIPASIGGAVIMNAGGAFGQIADTLVSIYALDRSGRDVVLSRDQIAFGYRASGLQGLIITAAELRLVPQDPATARSRQLEIMDYKKKSQPMADKSAGCVFKNPTLAHDIPELLGAGIAGARAGERLSAGLLIDRAGCKGMRHGAASVSDRHANFVVTAPGATASDVLGLMTLVRSRVLAAFGVQLEPEVVIWSSHASGSWQGAHA